MTVAVADPPAEVFALTSVLFPSVSEVYTVQLGEFGAQPGCETPRWVGNTNSLVAPSDELAE